MKPKIFMFFLVLSTAWILQSCDNDDDESITVPTELKDAFSSKYPNAVNVKWETKSGYYVADFYDGYEASAWFTPNGRWYMTETDIPYKDLPDNVKSTFENCEYVSWRIDDVDKLEREAVETIYVIEVENQNQELDLYYSADGVFIKSIVDTDDDQDYHRPTVQLTDAMKAFINENYQGARIMKVDVEDDRNDWDYEFTEVDIIHNRISKEVKFNKDGDWYSTSWDVNRFELPEAVTTTINKEYSGYEIDDVEYYEMADGSIYYLIELEGNNDQDIKIKIGINGVPL